LPDTPFIVIPIVTLLAFFIKGAAGFGTALILMPVATVLVGVHDAIVASAILDIIGGAILFFRNPPSDSRGFWIPMAAGMVAGSIIGGVTLRFVPVHGFELFLGVVIIFLGLWFLSGRSGKDESELSAAPPSSASHADLAVSTFSGFCGGLFGISGPPIVFYLGSRLAKSAFRSTLVAVFMFGAMARLITYQAAGLTHFRAFLLGIVSIPGLLLGLYLGNHLFIRIREIWFSRLIGVILIISALRLLFRL